MRTMRMAAVCGLLLVGASGGMRAQTVPYSEPADGCELSFSHFLVNSAHLYLMHAGEGKYADQVPKLMRDAYNALTGAANQGQQANPAVWFLLGRWYGMKGDLQGMDSSYGKAAPLEPKCAKDIERQRRNLWAQYFNRAVTHQQHNEVAAAKADFARATMILKDDPAPYSSLGNIAANESGTLSNTADSLRKQGTHADSVKADSVKRLSDAAADSAIANYRITIRLANDSATRTTKVMQDMRETASFNSARLFHRRKMYDSAAAYYALVRRTRPNDAEALTGLATVYAASGKTAAAQALYDTVIVLADSLDPLDLFAAGVELFKVNNFERAAQALRVGLARNPYYRDALYNLANTYLSQANGIQDDIDSILNVKPSVPAPARGGRGGRGARGAGPDTSALPRLRAAKKQVGDSMLPVVRRLLDVDPASKPAMRLLAAAYQQVGNDDSTLATLTRWHNLTFEVTVASFDATAADAHLAGSVVNLTTQPATEPAVTFEFLDKTGKVVATQVVPGGPLPANTAKPIELSAKGQHIAAWRYRVGA